MARITSVREQGIGTDRSCEARCGSSTVRRQRLNRTWAEGVGHHAQKAGWRSRGQEPPLQARFRTGPFLPHVCHQESVHSATVVLKLVSTSA